MSDIESQKEYYDRVGFSERLGFGSRPAVLVIDMCRGITEPGPMFIEMSDHIPRINAINEAARAIGAPVIFTTVAYHKDLSDAGTFGQKVPLLQNLLLGGEGSDIDPRLPVKETDHLLVKKFPSAFYGTNLQSQLSGLAIDTTIIVGNSTSGCVRATACDAISGSFRPIVAADCVADRAPLSHKVNLFDIDSKYADVVESSEIIAYLNNLASAGSRVAAE
tara:strand:- start:240 stop:899 length:660 start_codon:yes stop_codon:yes gene_type:complete